MKTAFRRMSLGCVVSSGLLAGLSAQAEDVEGVVRLGHQPAGVIRVSDEVQTSQVFRGQSEVVGEPQIQTLSHCEQTAPVAVSSNAGAAGAATAANNCPPQTQQVCQPACQPICQSHCRHGGSDGVALPYRFATWLRNDLAYKGAWFRGKFGSDDYSGYGHHGHHGRGGAGYDDSGYGRRAGCKDGPGRPLAGHYSVVYPVDPGYFDQRDGQVYAAPGYGGPVSVPLAPVVQSTYNYGWGVPSSRLTPVLHPATQAPVAQYPSPYPTAPIAR
ncbi:hypothetical protein SH668x_001180 [Planctomicrobium sp. SH668]|uniref:hypothetical protein n=1 Tax=Planctomicrobium sp. SH668 TaxID=3448126 RepID=UPI003F5BF6DF